MSHVLKSVFWYKNDNAKHEVFFGKICNPLSVRKMEIYKRAEDKTIDVIYTYIVEWWKVFYMGNALFSVSGGKAIKRTRSESSDAPLLS